MFVQETPLHQELHPPQPLRLLHPESRGRVGERRHPLQPKLAVLQPAVTGEVATSCPSPIRESVSPEAAQRTESYTLMC